ncbi:MULTISPECIES: aspartate 1-decarboxylase [unclassified Bradyrhizobium]
MEWAGFVLNERVEIYNIETGTRFATYVIEAPRGFGAGPGCPNRISAVISGASAGVRLPSGLAAG